MFVAPGRRARWGRGGTDAGAERGGTGGAAGLGGGVEGGGGGVGVRGAAGLSRSVRDGFCVSFLFCLEFVKGFFGGVVRCCGQDVGGGRRLARHSGGGSVGMVGYASRRSALVAFLSTKATVLRFPTHLKVVRRQKKSALRNSQ